MYSIVKYQCFRLAILNEYFQGVQDGCLHFTAIHKGVKELSIQKPLCARCKAGVKSSEIYPLKSILNYTFDLFWVFHSTLRYLLCVLVKYMRLWVFDSGTTHRICITSWISAAVCKRLSLWNDNFRYCINLCDVPPRYINMAYWCS